MGTRSRSALGWGRDLARHRPRASSARTAPAASLAIHAARISLGGVETPAQRTFRRDHDRLHRPRRHPDAACAKGVTSSVHGAGGVQIGGDVWSAGSDTATGMELNRRRARWRRARLERRRRHPCSARSRAGAVMSPRGAPRRLRRRRHRHGRDVRSAGAIDSRRAASRCRSRAAGPVAPRSARALSVAGTIAASGDSSTGGNGSDGSPVSLSAAGALSVGAINTIGAGSTGAGAGEAGPYPDRRGRPQHRLHQSAGGSQPRAGRQRRRCRCDGATVALGAVTTDAGDATSDPLNGNGEAGGPMVVKATGNAGVGRVSTRAAAAAASDTASGRRREPHRRSRHHRPDLHAG